MTTIESKEVAIARSAEDIHGLLQDMNNFEQLLPRERISEWRSDTESCSFKVQGAATIGLRLDGGTPPHHVRMVATDRSPFPFTLDVFLKEKDGVTSGRLEFNSELNPMLRMMVEKPLKNLFDHIADKMVAVYG